MMNGEGLLTRPQENDDHPARFGFDELDTFADEAPTDTPQALLRWAHARFGDELVVACSLGPEDVIILDLLAEVELLGEVRVFTLDTGRLHQETYELMDALRERYGVDFEVYFPDTAAVEQLMRTRGANSFYASIDARRTCCNIRKVEPLRRVLRTAAAWVTGIRAEQSPTRLGAEALELDMANGGLLKLNPLVSWTREQVWERIHERDIPYNVLHDRGFASIGCAPCTRAIAPGEDERAGRWWWERPEQRECGLHPAHRDD